MADFEFNRRTVISLTSGSTPLYPSDGLLPNDRLYPSGDSVYIDGYGQGITSGTLRVDEVVCNDLKFGQYCSNSFSCELFNMGDEDYVGWGIQVYQIVDDEISVPCFTGRIDSAKKDRSSTSRQIVAYDEMYFKRDLNVAEWWEDYWREAKERYHIENNISVDDDIADNAVTTSLKDLRRSLVAYCGLVENAVELLNDDLAVYKYDTFTSVTFGDLMRMICEVQLCFPNMNRRGVLEYVEFGTEPIDVTENVENYNATYEDYVTAPITGVGYYTSASELIQMKGGTDNVYPISGNIFLNIQPVAEIDRILGDILSRLSDIQYRPCNVPALVSDWSLALGSKVSTPMGLSYIMKNSFSGSAMVNQTFSSTAVGEYLNTKATDVNSQILVEKRINTLKRDIDETVSMIRGENGVESQIRQTNELIQLKVGKDEVVSSINASQEGIAIRADMIAFGPDETLDSYKPLFNDMEGLNRYAVIKGDNLVLGNPDAMTQTRLTSEQLQFIVADEIMAYFSARELKLLANLMIGNEWEWDNDTDNQTLTLRYMGD